MKKFFSLLIAACLMLSLCVPALGAEAGFGEGERVSLAIGGGVTKGKGFLKNFSYITESDMESIRRVSSGEATYRIGLGDSFSEPLSYSAFENHGTPTWTYRRGYGLDLELLAQALGVDCSAPVSVFVSSPDGMTKTLPDAFGVNTRRYCYDTDGVTRSDARTALLLFETANEAEELGNGVFPGLPRLGEGSENAVENVFAFGQTAPDEITSCYWVKNVDRLRFGAEAPAVTLVNASGKKSTAPISAVVSLGVWTADFGSVHAQGVPMSELLKAWAVAVPEDKTVIVVSDKGESVLLNDVWEAFLAFSATDSGSAVSNSTPLRLYTKSGVCLGDVASIEVVTEPAQSEPGNGTAAPGAPGESVSGVGRLVLDGILAVISLIAGAMKA